VSVCVCVVRVCVLCVCVCVSVCTCVCVCTRVCVRVCVLCVCERALHVLVTLLNYCTYKLSNGAWSSCFIIYKHMFSANKHLLCMQLLDNSADALIRGLELSVKILPNDMVAQIMALTMLCKHVCVCMCACVPVCVRVCACVYLHICKIVRTYH